MIALIMAGGIGSRFWPLSREDNPKQFLSIVSESSMIRLTVDRLLKKINISDIYIVTTASQVDLVKSHIPELNSLNIIVEPFGMNTAPCLALSLAWIKGKYDENEIMLVAAADHLISDTEEFYNCLHYAHNIASQNWLVTFGIKPSYPATSYGYIELGDKVGEKFYRAKKFVEKPDKAEAELYLQSGRHLWNSGMFAWKLGNISDAFTKFQPYICEVLEDIKKVWKTDYKLRDITSLYKQMPKIPVDIAIMEKSDNIAVVPSDFGWSDVGGWKALHNISPKDENDNYFKSRSLTIDSRDNYVYSDKLVTMIGVNHLVLIETEDVILVADKERSEEVKKIVKFLDESNQKSFL
jgi:mannose-1-phosphate guanylyltransferase